MLYALVFLAGLLGGLVAGVFLLLALAVPYLERFYVFRPARDILVTPATLGLPFDQCFIETPDGCRLSAWHLRPPKPVAGVIYFHGNGGNLGTLNEIFRILFQYDIQVFGVDYRGYGWSTGVPSEEGLYRDALATVQFFKANFHDERIPLVYWGRSLGTCPASFAAREIRPSGLILETAFRSKASLLKHYPRLRPFRIFSKYRFDVAEHLKDHDFAVLMIHGDKDRTVPLAEGRRLFGELRGPKSFYEVPGAGHVDLHMRDTGRYMERIRSFLDGLKGPTIH